MEMDKQEMWMSSFLLPFYCPSFKKLIQKISVCSAEVLQKPRTRIDAVLLSLATFIS